MTKIVAFEKQLAELPQVSIETDHVIHGGMYSRTILVKAGIAISGALIKVPTVLILNGHAMVTIGDETVELAGHHVLAASAGRKQAFLAVADTWLTMVFASDATCVEAAEHEFTDDADRLMSRDPSAINTVTITGE